jgi:hypothetical protein
LFDASFATSSLILASLALLPPAMYLISENVNYSLLADGVARWIDFRPTPSNQLNGLERFARNSLFAIAFPAVFIFKILEVVDAPRVYNSSTSSLVVGLVMGAGCVTGLLMLWVASIVFNWVVTFTAGWVSALLSQALNRITRQQMLRVSLGGDLVGEDPVATRDSPAWISRKARSLPTVLSSQIAHISDVAAGVTIARLRTALGTLAFTGGQPEAGDLMSDYLTWRELIHTSYFDAPLFRKLVAFIVSREPGFRPSLSLRSDPDYDLLLKWYNDLTVG